MFFMFFKAPKSFQIITSLFFIADPKGGASHDALTSPDLMKNPLGCSPSLTCVGRWPEQAGVRGRGLAGGVIANLGEVPEPTVKSQKADLQLKLSKSGVNGK